MHTIKMTLLALFAVLLSACSAVGQGPYSAENPERITADAHTFTETAALEEETGRSEETTPNIVTAQSEDIATAMGGSSAAQSATPKAAQTPVVPAAPTTPTIPPKSSSAQSVSVGGQLGLSVNAPYQQAWEQTKKALPQAGYPIMEQDTGSGTYYVLDKISSGGVIKRDTPIYQLHLKKTPDNKTVIMVNNAQNQAANPDVAARILNSLKTKLP